jgi:hypothetical protein
VPRIPSGPASIVSSPAPPSSVSVLDAARLRISRSSPSPPISSIRQVQGPLAGAVNLSSPASPLSVSLSPVKTRLSSSVSRPAPPSTTTLSTAESSQDACVPKMMDAQIGPGPSGSFIPPGPTTLTKGPAWTIVSVSAAASPATTSVRSVRIVVGAASAAAGAARRSIVRASVVVRASMGMVIGLAIVGRHRRT